MCTPHEQKPTTRTNEVLVGLLDHYQKQFQLQREVIDRWFQYYLLIIGAPFPMLVALLQIDAIRTSVQTNSGALCVLSVFLFFVGILFFGMHVRQRLNTIWLLSRITAVEDGLASDIHPPLWLEPTTVQHFGADFFLGLVHSLINSVWLAASIYLLTSPRIWPTALGFGVGFLSQTAIKCGVLRSK